MKQIAIILFILIPLFGFTQRYLKPQRVDLDTLKVKNPHRDTTLTHIAVFDGNGMLKYNEKAGGTSIDTAAMLPSRSK